MTKEKATAEASRDHNKSLLRDKKGEISELKTKMENLSQAAARLQEVKTEERNLSNKIDDFEVSFNGF